MAAKRRWKRRMMLITRSKLLSVAENQPRYGRENVPGKLMFPWAKECSLERCELSPLPSKAGIYFLL